MYNYIDKVRLNTEKAPQNNNLVRIHTYLYLVSLYL